MSVYLLTTLDTKGLEAALVRDRLKELGVDCTLVDTGCIGEPTIQADITRQQVFEAAGTTLEALVRQDDRGEAVTKAAEGATKLVVEAFAKGSVSGVLSLGGSSGTAIGTSAMRSLPIGVPKLMVSTLASGQVQQYVGHKDVMMLNSVVDIAGINRISRRVLNQAAAAMAGMVQHRQEEVAGQDKPLIAATMFGVTTPCVERARQVLEEAGYEVLVFHATGNGGKAMETLIADGLFAGVLDITTTEIADEQVGGILSAGPDRLTTAGRMGLPQVVSVGATDMVNFGPRETVPATFRQRTFHQHNPSVTLMRTTLTESAKIGIEIGHKAGLAKGPCSIMFPLKGVSAIDRRGQSFDNPKARGALLESIRTNCNDVELVELDQHINDSDFAVAAANKLLELMRVSA